MYRDTSENFFKNALFLGAFWPKNGVFAGIRGRGAFLWASF